VISDRDKPGATRQPLRPEWHRPSQAGDLGIRRDLNCDPAGLRALAKDIQLTIGTIKNGILVAVPLGYRNVPGVVGEV
jgi:hypothetical protein